MVGKARREGRGPGPPGKGFALQRTRPIDIFGIVKRGREAVRQADRHLSRSACQLRKGGGSMGDSIGTYDAGLWLERAEEALFRVFVGSVQAGDSAAADKWLGMLERLSIV